MLSGLNTTNSGQYPEGTSGNYGRDVSTGGSNNTWWSFGANDHKHYYTPIGSVSSSFSGTAGSTETTGSGTAVSILPPYSVKYCWQRTA